MREHYKRMIQDSEQRVEYFMLNQIIAPNHSQYGGFVKKMNLAQPKMTIYGLTTLLSLYNTEESRYYRNADAAERIDIALDYVARFQREDGTFDLLDCNFYSAPDTAFCLKRLLPSYRYLKNHLEEKADARFFEKIGAILKKGADGIAAGGFHTPNHRWAIASILMACGNIFQCKAYIDRANEYLNEGIDCNEYGEYAERSSGNYNRINDDAMILLYEETKDEKYLEYAERNLKMMFNYFEPDGSIFTKNSTRYDNASKFYPNDYYFVYLYMAYLRHNSDFAAAANKIISDILARGERTPDFLGSLMCHPYLIDFESEKCEFPVNYRMVNPESNLMRIRKENVSYTVLAKSPHFFYFQVGSISVAVRMGLSFFEKREFISPDIMGAENEIVLSQYAKGWFYKPFREKPATSDWWKMDNASREKVSGPELNMKIEFREVQDGVDMHIHSDGCDRVPFKLEFGIENDCFIKSDAFMYEALPGMKMVVRSGNVEIVRGNDALQIGPAFGKHCFIGGKDNLEDGDLRMCNLYFTDFTNTDRVIHFRALRSRFSEESDL